jgi:hypothetical protein
MVILGIIADLLLVLVYLLVATMARPAAINTDGALAVLWGDHDSLGDESERRIRYALDLWRSGSPSRLIFCIGGSRPAKTFSGSRRLCERLASGGVPFEALRLGAGSNDTVSNLSEITDMAERDRVQQVVAVVDPLQGFRVQMLLARGRDPLISVAPYDYATALPRVEPYFLWWRVHQEWLAIASLLLPETMRVKIIDALRQ